MTGRFQRAALFAVPLVCFALGAACGPRSQGPAATDVRPLLATDPVAQDADDPAIWVHPSDASRSLIIATNKVKAPEGALVVFGLDGKTRQTISNLDRPNNVDVEYGLNLRGRPTDIAVVTERYQHRLRAFRIPPDGSPLEEISSAGGLAVFAGEPGQRAEPMGIALYRRPRDGAIFAVVGRKSGPAGGYLWEYRLEDDGSGRVKATKVREFGAFSGGGEVEAIAVDDALGNVYYADEGYGVRKWHADPDHPDAARELAVLGREGFRGNREGIAIYTRADGTGYIVCTDQLAGNSRYLVYRREGKPGAPHDHSELVKVIQGGADTTDGIDASSAPLGAGFPNGLLVVMNSRAHNYLIYRWEDIANSGAPRLLLPVKATICPN